MLLSSINTLRFLMSAGRLGVGHEKESAIRAA